MHQVMNSETEQVKYQDYIESRLHQILPTHHKLVGESWSVENAWPLYLAAGKEYKMVRLDDYRYSVILNECLNGRLAEVGVANVEELLRAGRLHLPNKSPVDICCCVLNAIHRVDTNYVYPEHVMHDYWHGDVKDDSMHLWMQAIMHPQHTLALRERLYKDAEEKAVDASFFMLFNHNNLIKTIPEDMPGVRSAVTLAIAYLLKNAIARNIAPVFYSWFTVPAPEVIMDNASTQFLQLVDPDMLKVWDICTMMSTSYPEAHKAFLTTNNMPLTDIQGLIF